MYTLAVQVHDGPLLEYLGVLPSKPKFEPAFFNREVSTLQDSVCIGVMRTDELPDT